MGRAVFVPSSRVQSPLATTMTQTFAVPTSTDFRLVGRALLEQQLWCFGQDVLHGEGNALIRYGMQRTPPPAKFRDVPGIYSWQQGSCEVVLRGFGIGYSDRRIGTIFLGRGGFSPSLMPANCDLQQAWVVTDVGTLRLPRRESELQCVWQLCADCCRWLASYERWVRRTLGPSYRQEAIARRGSRSSRWVEARKMAATWRAISKSCHSEMTHSLRCAS